MAYKFRQASERKEFYAGEVVRFDYKNGYPCKRAIALLISPLRLDDSGMCISDFTTLFAYDLDKRMFLPESNIIEKTFVSVSAVPLWQRNAYYQELRTYLS